MYRKRCGRDSGRLRVNPIFFMSVEISGTRIVPVSCGYSANLLLWRNSARLACCWRASHLPAICKKTIAESGVSDRIIALTGTSNEELETLYSNALALIFPSLEEGFGWPIAEAQACGCPVATTNRPPMTEVAGGTVIFFDPDDPVGAAQAIAAGLRQREQLSEEGLKNVARFDEEKIVEEYRSLYASILTGRA